MQISFQTKLIICLLKELRTNNSPKKFKIRLILKINSKKSLEKSKSLIKNQSLNAYSYSNQKTSKR